MKKRLEKSLPIKSNLTLEEQIYFIEKTFLLLDNVKTKSIQFNKARYTGLYNEKYGFFKENKGYRSKKDFIFKFNPSSVITSETFLQIIDCLEYQKFNRLFTITVNKEGSRIKDNLIGTVKEFDNTIYHNNQEEISFSIDSSFLYLFRLNKKTFLKKSEIYIFEDHIFISFTRKQQKMLLYISI